MKPQWSSHSDISSLRNTRLEGDLCRPIASNHIIVVAVVVGFVDAIIVVAVVIVVGPDHSLAVGSRRAPPGRSAATVPSDYV